MDKMAVGIIMVIILVGVCFWIFNNPNGINTGLTNGSTDVQQRITNFDYNGSAAPGATQTRPQ
ncbi:hypothetical protein [Paenibacillus gansuensis]|uniref:Uncharacterized protein n=1 Tax=Paenibacillus gansuensis TaxID=306542 RepID=A0ABW5PHR8_9BACL